MLLFLLDTDLIRAQEWKSLKSYQKETGHAFLKEGCWLKKDRKQQNEVWKKANLYNLTTQNGNLKYKTISEIRDFYLWFDIEREKQGHQIKWIGIAEIVARQLSNFDSGFICFFIVRNKEVVEFANQGCFKVFEFAFPQLQNVYFSKEAIKGKTAEDWDLDYGTKEQCLVLEPLYQKLSPKALWKLDRIAKGKGIFMFAVPNELRYVGSIEDCQARFEHGMKIHLINLTDKNIEEKPDAISVGN
jgi:hypothetical protein